MTENNMMRMEHPPYSPDLAPCDYYLFGHLKDHFVDAVFEDEADTVRQISAWLLYLSKRQDRSIPGMDEKASALHRCGWRLCFHIGPRPSGCSFRGKGWSRPEKRIKEEGAVFLPESMVKSSNV